MSKLGNSAIKFMIGFIIDAIYKDDDFSTDTIDSLKIFAEYIDQDLPQQDIKNIRDQISESLSMYPIFDEEESMFLKKAKAFLEEENDYFYRLVEEEYKEINNSESLM
ncbi:hypothetical protein [Brevibacillus laterosporus]|uniref:hypothetical protein n=1 Tax=Brevibacillus laterosporus TaxID=1465 RepID=UPI0026561DA0|nr:hypothetical protein [Brevibacillus laterosporus]MDN9012399.1 hypothetical protein [Brevibacillus laterosporus]MDO0943538.1 hypothetical protein [Brevibacillus laterosporus]